jgi:hypothetical protein
MLIFLAWKHICALLVQAINVRPWSILPFSAFLTIAYLVFRHKWHIAKTRLVARVIYLVSQFKFFSS